MSRKWVFGCDVGPFVFNKNDRILYYDGENEEYLPGIYLGKIPKYTLYQINEEEGVFSEKPVEDIDYWEDMSLESIFACNDFDMKEECTSNKYCTWIDRKKKMSSVNSCRLKTSYKNELKIGDIIQLDPETTVKVANKVKSEAILITNQENNGEANMEGEIRFLDNNREPYELIPGIDPLDLDCKEIVAVSHGTSDSNLLKILQNNEIKALMSPMGLEKAVSTIPILDCDLGKILHPDLWGPNKIIMDASILEDYRGDWRLSCPTNVSANKRIMPFKSNNLEAYFYQISPHRSGIWIQPTTDIEKSQTNWRNYSGELAFYKNLKPIKTYVKFIMIPEYKTELIQNIQKMGYQVIPTPSDLHKENYLNPSWFR